MIPVLFNILLFLIPLVFYKNTAEIFEFNKIVTLYALTAIIASIWIINSIKVKRILFTKTLLDWPIVIYLVVLLVSALLSIDPRTSWLGYYGRFNGGLVSQVCYAILYWAFVSNLNAKQARQSLLIGVFSLILASILAIGEHFSLFTTCGLMGFGWKESCWVQDVQNRVYSTLGQPNWLAAMVTALIPVTWYALISKTPTIKSKSLWTAISVVFFVTLLFTKSRSGFLALGIEFLIFWSLVFWQSKLKYIKTFVLLSLLFGLLSFVFLFKPTAHNNEPSAVAGPALESGGTESGTIRKYVWVGAFEIFKNHPILGTGPETFAFSFPKYKPVEHNLTSEWDFIYNKAHNEFLNYLANTGILGFVSYLSLIIYSVIVIYKSKRFDLLAGYFSILVTNFFGFSVVPVSLLFFLLPAIAIVGEQKEETLKLKKPNLNQYILISVVFLTTLYSLYSVYHYWKADTHFNSAKAKNDITEINKALAISPNQPEYLAQLAYITSDVETSLRALSLNKYNQNSRKILIGNLVKNSENLQVAENIILEGITNAPNDPRLYYQLGVLQLKIEKTDEGLKNLERSVKLKSNYKEGRFALGITYAALKENENALEEFDYILKNIDPNDELTKKYLEASKKRVQNN